jgi:hypothetical protein
LTKQGVFQNVLLIFLGQLGGVIFDIFDDGILLGFGGQQPGTAKDFLGWKM